MLTPTSGDAVMNGRSILTDMPSIRADLGCCPQFDILWPEITVLEHLGMYAAIKGFRGTDARDAAAAAAAEVGRWTCLICRVDSHIICYLLMLSALLWPARARTQCQVLHFSSTAPAPSALFRSSISGRALCQLYNKGQA